MSERTRGRSVRLRRIISNYLTLIALTLKSLLLCHCATTTDRPRGTDRKRFSPRGTDGETTREVKRLRVSNRAGLRKRPLLAGFV
ncbi:MAG: hypothetical protein OXF02_03290 [Simkaniaceae bacterium]|nr:hypothetical protein [Simkaniaceae bacterium]